MIFTYNKEHVGDVLMVIVKNSGDDKLDVERKGNVARVFLKKLVRLSLGTFLKFLVCLKSLSAGKSF